MQLSWLLYITFPWTVENCYAMYWVFGATTCNELNYSLIEFLCYKTCNSTHVSLSVAPVESCSSHVGQGQHTKMASPHTPLGATISDINVAKIARRLKNWKAISPFLGLTESQEVGIERSSGNDYTKEKHAALRKWREMRGGGATYSALIAAAKEADNIDLADYVQSLQGTSLQGTSDPLLSESNNLCNRGVGVSCNLGV